jgi:hypothetical protein
VEILRFRIGVTMMRINTVTDRGKNDGGFEIGVLVASGC